MKKWFYSLDGKKQNIIIGVGWGLAALCCVIIGANPSTSAEPTALDYIFTMLFSVKIIIQKDKKTKKIKLLYRKGNNTSTGKRFI